MENKFRAVRYGLGGKMIDFRQGRVEVLVRELILEYLAFVDDVLDELGSRDEIELHPYDVRAAARAQTGSCRCIERREA